MNTIQISTACEPPLQPALEESDQRHFMYPKYLRYRNALSAQLVQCANFKNWLHQEEQAVLSEAANNHPLIGQYRAWLRDNVNCKNTKIEYLDFWDWLEMREDSNGGAT